MAIDWAPAGWYPDPSRSHEVRYYDGAGRTEHVADRGVASHAPLGQPPPGLVGWFPPSVVVRDVYATPRLPAVPRVKMWILAVLSLFVFWLTAPTFRIVLPFGIAFAIWCWVTTAAPLKAHQAAGSPAATEMKAARWVAVGCALFGLLQAVVWTRELPRPRTLLHYSEDPAITAFAPHAPRTNPTQAAAVWAIDPDHAPLYWFPRDCPRVAVWANDADQQHRLTELFTTDAARVQSVPVEWHDAIVACALYEYRFDAAALAPWLEAEGQWVAHEPVTPLAVEPVGDLLDRHARAGVDLRFVSDLAPIRVAALESGLPFSIVRFRP